MNYYDTSLDKLLDDAAEQLKAGRKGEARDLLEQALRLDRNNLTTWELLWRAAYNLEEEISSLKHILRINPRHAAARKRLTELQPTGPKMSDSQPLPLARQTAPRSGARRKRQQAGTVLLVFLGGLITVLCVSLTGLVLYRGGYIPFLLPSIGTTTAMADKNASCQVLIDRTIQASDHYCSDTGSNTACYGNNKLRAELAPNTAQRFLERGDIIPVKALHRLSASPLNLENGEWGIAVFKVVANLPRSLPGETVTMVVFGNSTLDNRSANSDSLESFYFTSELGQIVCEKIPFDGLMINSPDNSGIRMSINGTELTLIGSASIKAVKNGNMQVSVYKGSARLVANGQEQYVGAGQTSSVQLGGENGAESIGAPSDPQPLEGEELTMACTMTGQYCSASEITPVSADQAQEEIESAITSTPTRIATATIAGTASPTVPPTYTLVVLPQTLFPRTPTRTATATLVPTRTPTSTRAPTFTFTPSNTPTQTNTPTDTPTATATPISIACDTAVLAGALTSPNPNQLAMDITNQSGSAITINRFHAVWVETPSSQKIDRLFLNTDVIWNKSDPNSPSDFPSEGDWVNGANLTLPDQAVENFVIEFSDDLQLAGYEVQIVFDNGCQVIGTR